MIDQISYSARIYSLLENWEKIVKNDDNHFNELFWNLKALNIALQK